MSRHEADPIEFDAIDNWRVDTPKRMDSPDVGEAPWVQLCITGDDGKDLNLNLSQESAAAILRVLQELEW